MSVHQFLGLVTRLLPWERSSLFFGLGTKVHRIEAHARFMAACDWLSPLASAAQSGASTMDLLKIMAEQAPIGVTVPDLSNINTALLSEEFSVLWTSSLTKLLRTNPADISWSLCSDSERFGTQGHTCGLWMLFHYMAGAVRPT